MFESKEEYYWYISGYNGFHNDWDENGYSEQRNLYYETKEEYDWLESEYNCNKNN